MGYPGIKTKVIPQWGSQCREALLFKIKDMSQDIDQHPEMIHAVGSRVFGGFKASSDIDIVVYSRCVFTYDHKLESFDGIKLSIKYFPFTGSQRKYLNKWFLPYYDLLNRVYIDEHIDNVDLYRQYRQDVNEKLKRELGNGKNNR